MATLADCGADCFESPNLFCVWDCELKKNKLSMLFLFKLAAAALFVSILLAFLLDKRPTFYEEEGTGECRADKAKNAFERDTCETLVRGARFRRVFGVDLLFGVALFVGVLMLAITCYTYYAIRRAGASVEGGGGAVGLVSLLSE